MIYAVKGLLCQGHGGTEQSASLENIDEYISEPQSCGSEVFLYTMGCRRRIN